MAKCIIYGARGGSESPITITVGFSKSVLNGLIVTCASELLEQPLTARTRNNQAVFEVRKKGTYIFSLNKFDDLTVNVRTREPLNVTMQESLVRVTVYGAVNETITINGKQTVTSNAGTATMDIAPGTYTPNCSVSGWNTPVTVTKSTTKVYCRPADDKIIYWYGIIGNSTKPYIENIRVLGTVISYTTVYTTSNDASDYFKTNHICNHVEPDYYTSNLAVKFLDTNIKKVWASDDYYDVYYPPIAGSVNTATHVKIVMSEGDNAYGHGRTGSIGITGYRNGMPNPPRNNLSTSNYHTETTSLTTEALSTNKITIDSGEVYNVHTINVMGTNSRAQNGGCNVYAVYLE